MLTGKGRERMPSRQNVLPVSTIVTEQLLVGCAAVTAPVLPPRMGPVSFGGNFEDYRTPVAVDEVAAEVLVGRAQRLISVTVNGGDCCSEFTRTEILDEEAIWGDPLREIDYWKEMLGAPGISFYNSPPPGMTSGKSSE